MPATCSTRGVLKASTNRVRTSTALQGSAMWENVIGIVNEERGSNAGVEALINAPQHGGGRKAALERRARAAEAVKATGGFDTAVTDYDSLLALAKTQGAVGSANRGACKNCGQLGHLTKQCRNQFSKYYAGGAAEAAAALAGAGPPPGGAPDLVLGKEDGLSSANSSDSEDSEDERRRARKEKRRKAEKKERKEKRERREKRRRKEKKERKEKKSSKEKSRKRSRSRSGSDSDSD